MAEQSRPEPGRARPTQRTGGGSSPQRRRRRRRSSGVVASMAALYVVAVIGVSLILATVAWICAGDVLALNKAPHTAVVVLPEEAFTQIEVPAETKDAQGNTVKTTKTVNKAKVGQVADILKENGIIQYKPVFKLFVAVTGGDVKMSPGTYELNTDMDYRAIIASVAPGSASRSEISLTIPEGYSMDQIFHLLEEKGVATVADLTEMAANHDYKFDFLEGVPLGDAHRLEGYLFPDTYRFYIGEDPLYVLNKMLVNFTNMVPKETRQELAAEGKSLSDIIIIASLIEKETDGTDQTAVASVIYNRLERPTDETVGFLNIDAALVYAAGRPVIQEDYQTLQSPYNTYLNKGLPPGPIASPGMVALNSALNPQSTQYYYYAVGSDGLHHYFRTNSEFQNYLASLGNGNG